MKDKLSEDCRCEHWPACNRCLREELKTIKDQAICDKCYAAGQGRDQECECMIEKGWHSSYCPLNRTVPRGKDSPASDGKELDRLLSLRGKVFKTKEEYEEWLNDETPKDILILSKNECFIMAGLIKELVLVHGHDKTQNEKEIIDKIFKCAYPEKPKE